MKLFNALAITLSLALPVAAQGQWISMNGPYVYISDISIAGESLYVAGGSGVYLYDGNDQQWLPKGLDCALSVEANPEEPAVLLALRDTDIMRQDLHRSVDGGTNWEWTGLGGWIGFVSISIAPSDPSRVYTRQWRSDNKGATWDSIATQFWDYGAVVVHPQHKDNLYMAGWCGVYKSLDGGVSWDTLGFTGTSGGKVIAVDPNNGDIVYVGVAGDGVFKSVDGGAQWTPIDSGLTNLDFVDLGIDPNKTDHLYVATHGGGIYHSENEGLEWEGINEGLPSLQVTALAIGTRKIYIGFDELEGVYQREYVTSVQIRQKNDKPDAFDLSPNYPNPFNTQTTIQYDLPEASRVSLVIYDIAGREVRSWNLQEQAGYRQLIWDGTDRSGRLAPTSIYIYRFIATSVESDKRFTVSRKMVLLK